MSSLVQDFEPVLWVYARTNLEGQRVRGLQIRHLADLLYRDGAPDDAVAAVSERLRTAPVAPDLIALFAGPDGTILHEQRIRGDESDRSGYTCPAHVMPVLVHDQRRPAYVWAVVDRTGAELSWSAGGEAGIERGAVVGTDDEIERNAPGGWSQPRYQRRAEDSWRHNAAEVAAAVEHRADSVHADAVLLSGDVRAVQLVRDRLPKRLEPLLREVNADGSDPDLHRDDAAKLDHVLRDAADVRTAQLLTALQDRIGPGGTAVQGVVPTFEALAAGRVATLLISELPPERSSWFGVEGRQVYFDHDDAVRARTPVRVGSLADVVVRSAILSGAEVRVVPASCDGMPAEGLGALCRYAE